MSKKKKLILSIIQDHDGHLTADEVYRQAKGIFPHISLGTVYRNLGVLAESGQIRQVHMAGAPDLFDRSLADHGHLVCQECGAVRDIPAVGIQELAARLGEEIFSFELTLYHCCSRCRENKTN